MSLCYLYILGMYSNVCSGLWTPTTEAAKSSLKNEILKNIKSSNRQTKGWSPAPGGYVCSIAFCVTIKVGIVLSLVITDV